MDHDLVGLPSFTCIGIERHGPVAECHAWVPQLWVEFVRRSEEIRHLERSSVWGLMSDPDTFLAPWTGESGRYLAGCQVPRGTEAFGGWSVWTIPASCWMRIPLRMNDHDEAIATIRQFAQSSAQWKREGAVHELYPADFRDPNRDNFYLMAPLVPRDAPIPAES